MVPRHAPRAPRSTPWRRIGCGLTDAQQVHTVLSGVCELGVTGGPDLAFATSELVSRSDVAERGVQALVVVVVDEELDQISAMTASLLDSLAL